MFNRKDLKEHAKDLFRNNYWKCVLAGIIAALCAGTLFSSGNVKADDLSDIFTEEWVSIILAFLGAASAVSFLIKIFAWNPLTVSCNSFFINNHRSPASLVHLGDGFSNNYIGNVKTMFFMNLYTFLWSLLLIVPGIVKAYEYRMIPYLIAEDPNMSTKEAFARSKQMMAGNKWAAFVLDFSFIGWYILTGLTLGIVGIFWVNPYIEQTNAELYLKLNGTADQYSDYDQTTYYQADQFTSSEDHYTSTEDPNW